MALVLEVRLAPGPPRGVFRYCTTCSELYARAGADRRRLNHRYRRMLAREILRLRALVPPERRDAPPATLRPVAEDADPALPRNIGEAVERDRRREMEA
jgi:hypothetical protein